MGVLFVQKHIFFANKSFFGEKLLYMKVKLIERHLDERCCSRLWGLYLQKYVQFANLFKIRVGVEMSFPK